MPGIHEPSFFTSSCRSAITNCIIQVYYRFKKRSQYAERFYTAVPFSSNRPIEGTVYWSIKFETPVKLADLTWRPPQRLVLAFGAVKDFITNVKYELALLVGIHYLLRWKHHHASSRQKEVRNFCSFLRFALCDSMLIQSETNWEGRFKIIFAILQIWLLYRVHQI